MWELNCAIKVSVSSSPLPKIRQISRQYDQQRKTRRRITKTRSSAFNAIDWYGSDGRMSMFAKCVKSEKISLKMLHYGNFFPHEGGPGPLSAMDLTKIHISAALNAPELNISR